MAPKGGNAKKESGRAKKAENEAKKKGEAAAAKEREEAKKWEDGSKQNKSKQEKEEKRLQDLARKAERERLLAEEEASLPAKQKAAPKAGATKKKIADSRPAGPGAIAAGGGISTKSSTETSKDKDDFRDVPKREEPESFTATGIDEALELMDVVVNAKTDKATVGQQAATLERHPERRFKAAFEAYQERELPVIRKDHPGLRLQQYKELLYKQFQKSPENPFNQTLVSYDASKEERVEVLERRNKEVEERLRERTKALRVDDD